MCSNCQQGTVGINLKRLFLLLGFTGAVVAGIAGAVLLNPVLIAVLPLLLLAAGCPAMCAGSSLVSWVKGKKGHVHVQGAEVPRQQHA